MIRGLEESQICIKPQNIINGVRVMFLNVVLNLSGRVNDFVACVERVSHQGLAYNGLGHHEAFKLFNFITLHSEFTRSTS